MMRRLVVRPSLLADRLALTTLRRPPSLAAAHPHLVLLRRRICTTASRRTPTSTAPTALPPPTLPPPPPLAAAVMQGGGAAGGVPTILQYLRFLIFGAVATPFAAFAIVYMHAYVYRAEICAAKLLKSNNHFQAHGHENEDGEHTSNRLMRRTETAMFEVGGWRSSVVVVG